MDDRITNPRRDAQARRDEWVGIGYLLGQLDGLLARGLLSEEAHRSIGEEYRARREAVERDDSFAEAVAKARDLAVISPREALGWARRARELGPDRPEGWVAGVDLLRKMRRFDEAVDLADEAAGRFPGQLDGLMAPPGTRSVGLPMPSAPPAPSAPARVSPAPIRPVVPTVSWGEVAGEFLQEHWQKLISGLAVLLIVVSSTVGAHLVLGPQLWSPAGKSILALVFTAVCAGFGVGLVRWGAERAGRMMLGTALVVVPINLMLAGELRLLADHSAGGLALLATVAGTLLPMTWMIARSLGLRSPIAFAALFFALAAPDAAASPGMAFGAGFAAFLFPAAIFPVAVGWIHRRSRPAVEGEPADLAYLELGLFAFAFLSGILRTGAFVLHLPPALYAVPAMLAAIACAWTGRTLGPVDPDRRRALLIQQAGLALSGLAFALALARPPGPSSLLSGNTLATAVLGLGLYAGMLRATRHPAYLYSGFAALFLAYFGAFYFVVDLVHAAEEVARRAMGYPGQLPAPFKAINGLAFSVVLAWLSRFFGRRWSDLRLARHCHYINLPLSIGACVFAGFEPRAATICLGGYAALYAIGARVFARPGLVYLACAAAAGSALFGASLAHGASLGLGSTISALLGLAFWAIRATPWLARAGEPYRAPLLHSARAMAGLAMAGAVAASAMAGTIPATSTAAFGLTALLALLNGREAPRVSIFLMAIGALLGAWVGGFEWARGPVPASTMVLGLVVAAFAPAVLAAAEVVRARAGSGEAGRAFVEAVGWAVAVVVPSAWILGGAGRADGVPLALSLLVGGVAWLWLTRFRREEVLAYLGLAGLAGSAFAVAGLLVPWERLGIGLAWMGVTSAACALAAWGAGEIGRRRGWDALYRDPCFGSAAILAAGASALAIGARWDSVDSYRPGVAAMLAGSAAFGLVAWSRRRPDAVGLAVASASGASYLALFSQGATSPDSAWVLGLVAVVEAIACRGLGWLVRRVSGDPETPMARPLDLAAVVGTVAASALAYRSPGTMLLVAASAVLLVGAWRSAAWLYGAFFAAGVAAYQGGLSGLSADGLVPFVVGAAYASWGIALALERFGPGIDARLGLGGLRLTGPPARVAMGLGVLAAWLRLASIAEAGEGWARLAWLPWALAALCVLMLRFDPGRWWMHGAVALTGLGSAATFAPMLAARAWWWPMGMGLALAWLLAASALSRVEGAARRRLNDAKGFDPGVFAEWSLGAFTVAGSTAAAHVLAMARLALAGSTPASANAGSWLDVAWTLALAGLYVAVAGHRWGDDARFIGLEAVACLSAWWAGVSTSPFGLSPWSYYPVATAALALAVVELGWLRGRERSPLEEPGERAGAGPGRLRGFTSGAGFALGLAAVALSAGASGRVALIALSGAVAALGILALAWGRVESAYAGGAAWCLVAPVALGQALRASGHPALADRGSALGVGVVAGLLTLWVVAGRLGGAWKGRDPVADERVARALERVATLATVPSAAMAWLDGAPGAWAGVAILIGLAAFFGMMAWRRGEEWPVYVAQGLLLASYFRARPTMPLGGAVDAVALSMLGYLDLGLSEVLARLRLAHFARSTLRFALVLPMVALAQAAWQGHGDAVDLFILLATSAFYGLAALRLRSRTPAYAAAVLLNAFLWLAWARLGWRLSDHPQFYLIPVGTSAILFGEVNRRALGRSAVNAARNLGLVTIYASLAAPIWQSQSFGAWLALLLLSLLGIFAGIGLRVQSFLWMGLACFVADVGYQIGRLGMEHALARWGVMLSLGVLLILFVALNEKKRIVATMRGYYEEARRWE